MRYIIEEIYYVGAYYSPIGYTLPSGLQSVNGSSSTGGCQPESCVIMPIGGSTINGCDCPGNTPVNGTLIDGVIPSIDTTQQEWARELFTVNRNEQDSIMIGFVFLSEFYLRGIEIALFHCPILGIGITGVKVYSSFIFPSLLVQHHHFLSHTVLCPVITANHSHAAISIPVQPPMAASNNYFIEFLFTGRSSVHQLNWLYLGEIRFSNETHTFYASTTESEGEFHIVLNTHTY